MSVSADTRERLPTLLRLALCGLIIEAALLGIGWLGDLRVAFPGFLVLYALAFVAYATALAPLLRRGDRASGKATALILIIGFGVLFRATLLFSEPTLSDDIYRYLWDGKVQAEGINPYRHVPAAEALEPLRDANYQNINHREFGTPYGPLSEWVFLATQRLAPTVLGNKAVYLLFDLLCVATLAWLLASLGKPRTHLAVYAWNPLVLIEVAGSGHNDTQALFFLLLACALLVNGKRLAAPLAMAAALLSKYFAVLALLPVWQRLDNRGRALLVALTVAGFMPFAEHLESHLMALAAVGSDWQFNASLYTVISLCCASGMASKLVALGLFLLLMALLWRRRWPLLQAAPIAIGAALLLTTTLQPWYMVWLVPFLVLYPNRAWLLLTGLVMLSYLPYHTLATTGTWAEPAWLGLVIYLPFYTLLVGDWLRRRRSGSATVPASVRSS